MSSTASLQLALSRSSYLTLPQPLDEVLTRLTEGLSLSASLRMAWTAMIATPVRKQHRLIALFTSAQPLLPASNSQGLHFNGLCDDDTPRYYRGPDRRHVSAGKIPQVRGKSSALIFDVAGLVTWLKDRYPRSTIHHVEAETGIPAASVENWLHRRTLPSVQHFSILVRTYGPSLLVACFPDPPEWVDEAARLERRREIDEQIAQLERERMAVGGSS
ncbi:hypothetical protein [Sinorhizobium chiapasense]|uniref:Transcriptional regulator n=1 Tax=Sinorhizobium chiapasense TaxID=501572 RepID=A0ABZ2BB44_9HYPH